MTNFEQINRMNFRFFLPVLFSLVLIGCQVSAQNSGKIGFYNVENLFDTLDTPGKDDAEFLPNGAYQWTSERYAEKIKHINEMFDFIGRPTIFGMCEIENAAVVEDVIKGGAMKGHYELVHFESADNRGIDNALVFDTRIFKLEDSGYIRFAMPENSGGPSRDILWAKLAHGDDQLLVMVNHWPSRSGGQVGSEPKRLIAATAARSFIDSVQTANPNLDIVFMGDLNDYPEDRAPQMISSVLKPQITPASGEFGGTHHYDTTWHVLDHMMVSASSLKKKGVYVKKKSGKIHSSDLYIETYKGQRVPWRTYGGKKYLGGYSDHLPVTIDIAW
jgi:predicted extracellular nuclease